MNLLDSLITGGSREKKETFSQATSLSSLPSLPEPDSRETQSVGIPPNRPAGDSPKSHVGTRSGVPPEPREPEAGLPESVLTSRYPLSALSRAALDSLPAAGKLSPQERRIILDALEVVVLNWLRTVFQPESAWEATCPKGHAVHDGVFARCLLGWNCEQCQQVYAPGECKLRLPEAKGF